MLTNARAFSSFSANNLDSVEKFYSEVLGLKVEKNIMGILDVVAYGGFHFIVYPKPNHEPANFTVLNFVVTDIEKTVDELIAKGVAFEQYDSEYLKTDSKGICRGRPNIAWFKDPAGNILSVIEDN